MTGPEHYAEAERLLAAAGEQGRLLAETDRQRQAAQVHATLALAAATAMSHWNGPELPMPQDDRLAWLACASEKPAGDAWRREAERAEAAGGEHR